MINITNIKGISNSYPEEIEGTNEWYSCREGTVEYCDLYEAQEIFNNDGFFKAQSQNQCLTFSSACDDGCIR